MDVICIRRDGTSGDAGTKFLESLSHTASLFSILKIDCASPDTIFSSQYWLGGEPTLCFPVILMEGVSSSVLLSPPLDPLDLIIADERKKPLLRYTGATMARFSRKRPRPWSIFGSPVRTGFAGASTVLLEAP
jgi:hypothetical protein